MHENNLIHRDIKPNNIFIVRDQTSVPAGVKLLDFGLMRRSGRTKVETLAGTPDHMAPEQVLLGTLDARTDLYLVGVLGFVITTGKLPFGGKTSGQRAIKRLADHHRTLDVSALGSLGPILLKAMEPNPDDRYASADAMADALRRLSD